MSVLNRLSPGRNRTRPGGVAPPTRQQHLEAEREHEATGGAREADAADRPATGPEAGSAVPGTAYDERAAGEPTVPVAPVADTRPHERVRGEPREDRGREEVIVTRWSPADAVVVLIGAALAAVGIVALVRAGINETWYRPVVDVARANHTALLGAIEVGAGALLVLAGVARSRVLATLFGVALAVAGAVAIMEASRFERRLAIEEWWAWVLIGAGVVVALMGLVPRRARVRRVPDRA